MALSHPYSVQQNQLLKEEMNFQKSNINHALVKYSTTTTAANFLCGILAFTPLCSYSHKMKLNTIKTQFVVHVAIELIYQATPMCYNHLHGHQVESLFMGALLGNLGWAHLKGL